MLDEGRDILYKLDRSLPPTPPHLYDTTMAVSALEHLDTDAHELVCQHADDVGVMLGTSAAAGSTGRAEPDKREAHRDEAPEPG
jgi:hypothetical protein